MKPITSAAPLSASQSEALRDQSDPCLQRLILKPEPLDCEEKRDPGDCDQQKRSWSLTDTPD
jgi:hypothetical protein